MREEDTSKQSAVKPSYMDENSAYHISKSPKPSVPKATTAKTKKRASGRKDKTLRLCLLLEVDNPQND